MKIVNDEKKLNNKDILQNKWFNNNLIVESTKNINHTTNNKGILSYHKWLSFKNYLEDTSIDNPNNKIKKLKVYTCILLNNLFPFDMINNFIILLNLINSNIYILYKNIHFIQKN